jgi:hypothetical protein
MWTMPIVRNRWGAGVVLIVIVLAPARAELVYFKQGGRVQLPATPAGDGTIRLEMPDGPVLFAASDFRKIVPGHCPERTLEARLRDAPADGGGDRLALAWWALEHGLTPQVEALLRAAHRTDPGQAAVARMVAALDRLDAPGSRSDPEPALDAIYRALGGSFDAVRGPHVFLLHQQTVAEAAERLDLLERVVRTYYLWFAAQGIELPVPGQRLVSAWFAEQHDYLAFLHAEGADAFRTTLGYYHPTLQAVVTFDVRSARVGGALAPGRAATLTRPGDATASGGASALTRPSGTLSQGERDLARRRVLLETERRSVELGTAVHEMVHLLVARSGLEPHPGAFPLWLHEGLAAQFEVVRGGRWAGFGRAHDLRLPDWRKIDPPARLVPLIRDAGFGHGYDRSAYAAAWALVYYLRKEHPREFVTLIDLLRAPDAEVRPRADRTVALVSAAFGADLHALEADWHRYMAQVRTPLEEGQ